MPIRQLPDEVIDQIAAGEVVERPASVVKELVENALDAGARRIGIVTAGGGKTLIRVSDDGGGIPADELALAVHRHCTSKLGDDVSAIRSLGFRGEALPSIGSVARLTLRSRRDGATEAAEVLVEHGRCAGPRPAALGAGTVVEVRDLFQSVPARLKFLKNERAESSAVTDIVRRLALAFPAIRFELSGEDRTATVFEPAPRDVRIADVVGADFPANAVAIEAEREGARLSGLVGLPTFTRGNALLQHVFVNDRPVRDKALLGALRAAYSDVMARDRHPVAVLFLQIDPAEVDVNVHPAKADVRFRDPGLVRGLVIGAIREALARAPLRAATTGGDAFVRAAAMAGGGGWQASYAPRHASATGPRFARAPHGTAPFDAARSPFRPLDGLAEEAVPFAAFPPQARRAAPPAPAPADEAFPLGAARAQLHKTYIVAETADSLVIVDQHAAHERLVYEALKAALAGRPAPAQLLLIPEIVELPAEDCERLVEAAPTFERFGLAIERFGPGAVAVRGTPAMLGNADAGRLVRDLADDLADGGTGEALAERLDRVAATMACHGSVRAGRTLRPDEMDALLRQMEATPGAGQCNHGRPTFVELKRADIERLFERR